APRLDEALAYNRKAVELSDTYAVAHNNLGVVYRRLGRVSDALRHFHRASEIDPHLPSARNNLGVTLLQRGRPEQVALAVDFLRQAVALAPRSAKFRFDLASGLVAAGRAEEAAQQFAEGLRLDPGWLAIVAREAWRLATTDLARQPGAADEAIFLARQACQATGFSQAEPLDILGAAYAAAGRFDDAVTTARQALDWLPAHAPAEQRRAIEQRLRLYEKRSPYQASAD
ncbi:MAG: tetratricopeptide repeat protein, partial [Gemmataceae bacterium]|nr:tetratricopeptide repeat protein [Gemmataceae bacterium]MDW8264631.1 tetratricopeptide repeat protein [Gemmataceae bacterium]